MSENLSIHSANTRSSEAEVLHWIKSRARENWKSVLIVTFFALASISVGAVQPFVIRSLIDTLITTGFSWFLALAAIVVAGVSSGLDTLSNFIWQVTMRDGHRRLALEIYSHLQNLPILYLQKIPTGVLMARVLRDTNILGQTCVTYYAILFINLIRIAASATVLFVLEWRLASVALALVPISYLLLRRFNWKQRKGWEEER